MTRLGIATVAALVALQCVGCASPASPPPEPTPVDTGPIAYATGSTDLVLQVSSGGGLLPEGMRLVEMPAVSIYGDGRVVTLGAHGTGPTDPLLPELMETHVSADGMGLILAVARAAGALGPDRHYELPNTYDLWTVRFTVTAGGKTHRVSVFGLGFAQEDRLAPPGEMQARSLLASLYERLTNLQAWLPEVAMGAYSAYEPGQTRVFMAPQLDWSSAAGGSTPAPASPRIGQEVRDWPFAQPPESLGTVLDPRGTWYCVALDVTTPLGLATATWDTRWRTPASLYQIVARPNLPDETGCPAGV